MRKFLSIIVVLMMSLGMKAQTNLTEAVDIHSVDEYGREVHLFDILDEGKFAALYFFFSDAETSPVFDPSIAEAYHHFGDNKEDVYFIGVAPSDDSVSIDYWRDTYTIDFPVINRLAGGDNAHVVASAYGVTLFSTFVLIAPDREILIDNIWPIPSGEELIAIIEEETAVASLTEMDVNSLTVSPNPATSVLNIKTDMLGEADVKIYDMAGRCVKETRVNDISNATVNINDVENGIYIVNVNGKMTKLIIQD